jgi:hypothetical protein
LSHAAMRWYAGDMMYSIMHCNVNCCKRIRNSTF